MFVMSQEIFASTGATGTIHGTHNGGANSNITLLIALKPAGATATPTPTPTPPPGGGLSLPAAATSENVAAASTLTIGIPPLPSSADVIVAPMSASTSCSNISTPSWLYPVLRVHLQ